jgi:hypothetical protein
MRAPSVPRIFRNPLHEGRLGQHLCLRVTGRLTRMSFAGCWTN